MNRDDWGFGCVCRAGQGVGARSLAWGSLDHTPATHPGLKSVLRVRGCAGSLKCACRGANLGMREPLLPSVSWPFLFSAPEPLLFSALGRFYSHRRVPVPCLTHLHALRMPLRGCPCERRRAPPPREPPPLRHPSDRKPRWRAPRLEPECQGGGGRGGRRLDTEGGGQCMD